MTALWHPFADMGAVSQRELVIERGEGVHVFDADGRRYLDGTASLWYSNLGYGRREITEAVAAQMDKLGAYPRSADFSNPPANALAERLAAHAPMDDAKVFLASGGGDAVDTAAKLARRHWVQQGRPERAHIISRSNGYHGTHGFGTSIGGMEANVSNWGPLIPHTSAVCARLAARARAGDPARRPGAGGGVLLRAGDGRRRRLSARSPATSTASPTCARSTASCSSSTRSSARFGRLGTWFGIERWPDVRPDMITFAKGVTSGYLPLGGVIVAGHVAAPFFAAPGGADAAPRRDLRRPPDLLRGGARRARHLRGGGPDRRGQRARGPAAGRARPAGGASRGRRGAGRAPACSAAVALSEEALAADPTAPPRSRRARARRACSCARCCSGVAVSPPLIVEQEHLEQLADGYPRGAGTGRLSAWYDRRESSELVEVSA